jgi:hypothetical protein
VSQRFVLFRRANLEDSKILTEGIFRIFLFGDGPRLFGMDQEI